VTATFAARAAAFARSPGGRAGRVLATGISVDAVGRGLFLAGSVVFFTRQVGLTAAQVGLGLTIAGVVGLVATLPVGVLADRYGPRPVLIGLNLYRAAALAAYTLVDTFGAFVVVAGLVAVAAGSTVPVVQALVGGAVGAEERVTTMGYLRAVQNAGFAVGGLLAAGVIAVDTRSAYVALILVNAVSFVVSATMVRRLPPRPSVAKTTRRVFAAVRDRRLVATAACNGVLMLHTTLLAVGVPLWILLHTDLPAVVVAGTFVMNTVLAVALQVPVSATATTLRGGAKAFSRTGYALAATCVLLVASGYTTGWTAGVLLVLSVVALTFGEMLQAAAAWSVGYAMAPEDQRASYMAVLGLGGNAQSMAGPVVVTAAVGAGWWGLMTLAAVLLVTAQIVSRVVGGRQ
jgi:MFS family permease